MTNAILGALVGACFVLIWRGWQCLENDVRRKEELQDLYAKRKALMEFKAYHGYLTFFQQSQLRTIEQRLKDLEPA